MALGFNVYLLLQMIDRLIEHAAGAAWEHLAAQQCRL